MNVKAVDSRANQTEWAPMGAWILIRRREAMKKSAGGMFIPTQAQERECVGVVLAVGPEVKNVKVGMLLLFNSFAPVDVPDSNRDDNGQMMHVMVNERDVLATGKENKNA